MQGNLAIDLIRTRSKGKTERFQEAVNSPRQAMAELCRRNFFYFMNVFWDVVSPEEPKWNWHIEYLTKELEIVARRVAAGLPREYDLIINIPPGTTKSITCSIMFPVWCWINWAWMRFIVASYSGALSLEHAEYSRDLVRSDKFKWLFPELEIKQDKDTKSNFRIQTKAFDKYGRVIQRIPGGNRFSTSVGGTLTGFHAHIALVDDALDPNRAVSDVELKSTNRWIDQTLSTRKIDKAVTVTVLIMQRLHQNDPAGHILDKKKANVKHICLPGEIKNYEKEVKPPELIEMYVDQLLDPVRMDWAVMKDLEADLGQYGYAGQVGQLPTPPGGGMFKVDHFHNIDMMPAPINIIQTVRYWDKAGTDDGGAYTVGTKMHKLRNGKFLISDVKRFRKSSEEREAIIKETAEADGREVVIYMEQEPGSSGKDSVNASIRNLSGFAAYPDSPTGDKVYRADPFSVQVNGGSVLLLMADWNRDFLDEYRFFPFSTYKDQVDSGAGAFNKLAGKREVRVLTKRG